MKKSDSQDKGVKMRQMILLFSHSLSDAQKADARENYGIDIFIPLREDMQKLWSSIPVQSEDISNHIQPIKAFVEEVSREGDVVLIQGDFGATYALVNFSQSLGLIALYATTKRNVVEKSIDGKVVKTSVFEHVIFREYK